MRLKDKVVIVTGAGQGLGEAFCKGCAKEGANVVIVEINEETGKSIEHEIGGKAVFIRTDVSSQSQVKAMVDEVMKRFGKIDALIVMLGFMPEASSGKKLQIPGKRCSKLTSWESYTAAKQ